ncbi:LPS O-antigen length regulator Wzz(fepE) [Scandinavium manionii]|uniref:LPS O-antigen length regulator Wzz(fepE) n=1 Tax=Scandinavium manionii TaxID=2926520 RepID=UPI0021663277|nr:LPS O-antigen length regulator Wzz(fepE) [Scandinavium manionii]MCS2164776.1 LPS O-antigen length regulator Wzz(fepE) [Scandinavium manionii]
MSTMDIKPQSDAIIPFPRPDNGHEIDLLALVDILWRAKKRILGTVFSFALMALAISFCVPQKWTSSAVVTQAERTQLVPLYTMLSTVNVLGADINVDSTSIFNLFIKKFNSSVMLEEFVKSSPQLMSQFDGVDVEPAELYRAVVAVSEKMKAVDDASNKKEPMTTPYHTWTLSFTGPQPEETQSILADYMKFVADKVVKQIISDINETVALKIQAEKQRLELDRAKLEYEKETKIKRLDYSLQVAKAAGINKPVYSNGQAIKDDPDFSVTLGSDGINKKLEIEKSIDDVFALNAEILNREYRLKKIEQLNIQNVQFPVVNYQLSPSLPVKKDGPGKSLIVLLAALLGGMIGCGVVLFQHARESRLAPRLLEEKTA